MCVVCWAVFGTCGAVDVFVSICSWQVGIAKSQVCPHSLRCPMECNASVCEAFTTPLVIHRLHNDLQVLYLLP